MKPEEIKSFLETNRDLLSELYANEDGTEVCKDAVIVDNMPELFKRLFESEEYKAFAERSRWQWTKDVFMPNIDRVWTFER